MEKLASKLRTRAMSQELDLRFIMNKAADRLDMMETSHQELARITTGADELLNEMCDRCCRYPDELNQEDLDEVCLQCPVTKLAELIGV